MVRIAIINGHPDPSGTRLNDALANAYAEAALAAGSEVRRIDVARMDFPLLRNPDDFFTGEAPEAIREAQRDIEWADHLVFFFPLWAGDMPALLKGFVEQTFRPGFAIEAGTTPRFPKRLLLGRSARIVTTMGMPAFIYRTMFGAHALKAMTISLRMCGVSPVEETIVGGVGDACEKTRSRWTERMTSAARADAAPGEHRGTPLRTAAAIGLGLGAAYLGRAAWRWARYGSGGGDDALLDEVMPHYEVSLHHEVEINAPADLTFEAIQHTDFEHSLIVKALFRAREILLGSRPDARPMPSGFTHQLQALGWSIVAEEPGRELVFGTVTQPWQPNPVFRPVSKEEFASYNAPGFAKIAFTLRVDPLTDATSKARTETRVQTTDALSRTRFRKYWALLSPGMELIRLVLLQQLKTEAESRWKHSKLAT